MEQKDEVKLEQNDNFEKEINKVHSKLKNKKNQEDKKEKFLVKDYVKDVFNLKEKSKLYGALMAVYTMLIILAGIASTMLIPVVDDSQGKTGVTLVTSFAFPLSAGFFVLSNLIAEIFGKKKATFALIFGYVMGMFVSFWLFLGWISLKHTSINNYYGGPNDHFFPFDALGPSWRFFIAGLIAFSVSTSVNVGMIWSWKKKYQGKHLTARLFISSLIGQAIDNMTFGIIAFSPIHITAIEFNWQTIFSLAWFEWVMEIAVEAMLIPITHLIIKKVQKAGLYEDLQGHQVIYQVIQQNSLKDKNYLNK